MSRHASAKKKETQVASTREQVIIQLAEAGFQADTFPDSVLAMFAAMAGLRSDVREVSDALDSMGALFEEYLFEEEK